MRRFLTLLLILTLAGITATAQSNKPLKVTHFDYSFKANDGTGENGSFFFLGAGFSGVSVAGTNGGWTFEGNAFLPGESVEPVTNIFPGECCGYLDIGGTIYPWPDPNTEQSFVSTNLDGIAGKSFTFPPIVSTTPGTWVVQVPAKVFATNGPQITITYWTNDNFPGTTSRLLIRPGKLTLTWSFFPPNEFWPDGFYIFVEGIFAAESKMGQLKP